MVCNQCGYRNEDTANTCRSCGASLGAALTQEEAAKVVDELNRRYHENPLQATKFDKVSMWIFFASAVVFFVLGRLEYVKPGRGTLAAVLAVSAGVVARFPRIGWFFDSFKMRLWSTEQNPQPNNFWIVMRKVSYLLIFALAVSVFLYGLFATYPRESNFIISFSPEEDFGIRFE